MIYTIGYQRLTSRRLDPAPGIRRRPPRRAIRHPLPAARHELGGRGHTAADGIDRLRLDAERAPLILLCMEEAPGDCHRHHSICAPHFTDAVHIFGELQGALDAGDVARLYGETADLFK
jgi:phosphatidylserine decarboxylase